MQISNNDDVDISSVLNTPKSENTIQNILEPDCLNSDSDVNEIDSNYTQNLLDSLRGNKDDIKPGHKKKKSVTFSMNIDKKDSI